MKKLLAIIALSLAGCGFLDLNPEEQADIYALTSAKAIKQVQVTAKRLYDTDSISTDDYAEVLVATIRLIDLVDEIERASDLTDVSSVSPECVKIDLSGSENTACNLSLIHI